MTYDQARLGRKVRSVSREESARVCGVREVRRGTTGSGPKEWIGGTYLRAHEMGERGGRTAGAGIAKVEVKQFVSSPIRKASSKPKARFPELFRDTDYWTLGQMELTEAEVRLLRYKRNTYKITPKENLALFYHDNRGRN